jgi:hypothetical protein
MVEKMGKMGLTKRQYSFGKGLANAVSKLENVKNKKM